jgi:nicotinamide phosphoribosyltransferase
MWEKAKITIQELDWKPSDKGLIELLWDTFGGTINEQGYKVLDSHIGAIYGDSITIERCEQICERLKAKGFASTNIVFGVGSYSMGYATRDNQGGAVKSTYVEINGEGVEIFKDPVTDDGTKKSAKGLLKVVLDDSTGVDVLKLQDQCTIEEEKEGLLSTIFLDGVFYNPTSLTAIRTKIDSQI